MIRYALTNYLFFCYLFSFSQVNIFVSVDWRSPGTEAVSESNEVLYLQFAGCIINPDNNFLPYYHKNYNFAYNASTVTATIVDPVVEALSDEESAIVRNVVVSNNFTITAEVILASKKPMVSVLILPLRHNPRTGVLEKLLSATVLINAGKSKQNGPLRSYVTNSVLSSGDWFKMGIIETGMYKLSYTDMESLGIDMTNLSFSSVNIYGNGGAMLPEDNSVFRYDDLQLNAIEEFDLNSNAIFDTDDYVIFYAEGSNSWQNKGTSFEHVTNVYSDTAFYFIGLATDSPKRVINQTVVSGGTDVTTFSEHLVHEVEGVNLIKSGRAWYGEKFDILTSYDIPFLVQGIDVTDTAQMKVSVVSHALVGSETFSVNVNSGLSTSSINVPGVSGYTFAATGSGTLIFVPNSSTLNVNMTYSKNSTSSTGYLNYLEINVRRHLTMYGDQMGFRDLKSVGIGNVSHFRLNNATNVSEIWEVTDLINPKKITATVSGAELQFAVNTDSLREFIAFTGAEFYQPISIGKIDNQDLHGLTVADLVIVAPTMFLTQANQLADFHRSYDGLTVIVVTPEQIYNEFSSGSQDITAIKWFMKMFYDRAGTDTTLLPKYLLLFGDSSYDPKHRLAGNTNFIPVYESPNSVSNTSSFVTDDYFGLLDDNEGAYDADPVDIGIGRFPIKNVGEAQDVVNKIIHYVQYSALAGASCGAQNESIFGDWRNDLCFVADDEDSNLHMGDTEDIIAAMSALHPEFNVKKIFFDAFLQESTPGGQRYPEVNERIKNTVQNGVLIINYVGHGGEVGWAHERVLDVGVIQDWTNINNMPLFMTATCEFTRFDDPGRTSAGELVFLNGKGGGCALLTTTRLVFSGENKNMGMNFWTTVFDEPLGESKRLGDIVKITKVLSTNTFHNHRSFSLIGDPAMKLAIPKHDIITNSVNTLPVPGPMDTISALSSVTITGEIKDVFGNKLTGYNGIVYPTVFDKIANITTLQNDGFAAFNFQERKNIIYKGKATVSNGDFSFTFIVPKDIAYYYGTGRVSYYAVDNNGEDAHGFTENVIVGGTDTTAVADQTGPEVNLYLNDEKFVFGGMTDESPFLLAKIFDDNGINTVGNGIGHDITTVLDENTSQAIVLNDYYESNLDTYKSGRVNYPFSKLSEGTHTLTFKVWDVQNNSSTASTEFIVASSEKIALDHVLNYPNPFTTSTEFWFEHNQHCIDLEVNIAVFTVAGNLVKTINTVVETDGYRVDGILWDGRDDYGSQLARGVYMYKISVTSPTGGTANKYEKLVILK